MVRSIAAWMACLSMFLAPLGAYAFFGSLEDLKQEFQQLEEAEDDELTQVLRQLDEVSGTVRFRDVPEDSWFHRYVSSVARWGIVSGYRDTQGDPTGEYGPGNLVTIAEVLKMALRSARIDETRCSGALSNRQAQSHWARAFVVCAEASGVRLITRDTDLDRPATRAEVVAAVHDAFADRVPPLLSTFQDTAGHALESDVAFAAALGIVSGDADSGGNPTGTFRPDDSINRAEVAKIIYRKLRVEAFEER